MMMRKPASDAIEIALIDAGRRGESASASAAKSDTSTRSAANRRKIDVRTGAAGGGAAASTSTTAGCSSTSSNRITPSHSQSSQRQIFYVNLVQQVFGLA